MYRVTGVNLFGQWLEEDRIIPGFRVLTKKNTKHNFDLNVAKLTEINWAYNIFQIGCEFYVAGDWDGKENQLIKVDLPDDCNTVDGESNLEMVGNDYNLLLTDKKANTMWVISLEEDHNVKKININIEAPLENSSKRARRESHILKVENTNNSLLCLTSDGRLYSGALPSLMDTSHCVGKVCDVQCGYEHFMLLTDVGRVYTWGNGRRLQLGHGDLDNLDSPTEVEALAGIKITKIRAGGWHCFALSEFGDLYTWGWNDTGQLGVRHPGTKGVLNREGLKSYPIPTLVDIIDEEGEEITTDVIDIGCGSRHSAVLLADHSVWTTGYNKYGQLGFSPDEHPTLNYYTKTFCCEKGTEIACGHWSTVLKNKNCTSNPSFF